MLWWRFPYNPSAYDDDWEDQPSQGWGNVYNQAWPAVLGKILAACGFVAGLGFLLIHNGVLGRG